MPVFDIRQSKQMSEQGTTSPPAAAPSAQNSQQSVPARLLWWFNNVINPLRDELGTGDGDKFETPAIIVFGSEDSGKSSLMNGLIGMELLPSKTGVCTRLPIEIQLRTGPVSVECYDAATNTLLAGTTTPTSQWLAEVLAKANASEGDKISSTNSILVKVSEPNVARLDFIDLPGLMSVARHGFPPDSPQVTRARTIDYLKRRKNNAIMLLVCDATTPVIQTVGMQIVQELRLEQQTIAVLTRCDRVNQRFLDESVVATMEGRKDAAVVQLTNGYFATTLQVDGRALSVDEETNWFIRQSAFERVLQKTGRFHLMNAIQQMFIAFIKSTWIPSNIGSLQRKIHQLRKDYVSCGSPVSQVVSPESYLGINIETLPEAELLRRFRSTFQTCLEGCFLNLKLEDQVTGAITNQLAPRANGLSSFGSPPPFSPGPAPPSIELLRALNKRLAAEESVEGSAERIVDSIIDMVVKPLSSEVQRHLKKSLEVENKFKVNRFTAVDYLLRRAGQAVETSSGLLREMLLNFLNRTPFSDSFLPDLAKNEIKWISTMVLAVLAAPLNLELEAIALQEREDVMKKRMEITQSLVQCLHLEHVMKNPEQAATDQANQSPRQ